MTTILEPFNDLPQLQLRGAGCDVTGLVGEANKLGAVAALQLGEDAADVRVGALLQIGQVQRAAEFVLPTR